MLSEKGPEGLNRAVPGSGFTPTLARGDMAMKLFSHSMDLTFHDHILTCQVWTGGSRVTTDGYCF